MKVRFRKTILGLLLLPLLDSVLSNDEENLASSKLDEFNCTKFKCDDDVKTCARMNFTDLRLSYLLLPEECYKYQKYCMEGALVMLLPYEYCLRNILLKEQEFHTIQKRNVKISAVSDIDWDQVHGIKRVKIERQPPIVNNVNTSQVNKNTSIQRGQENIADEDVDWDVVHGLKPEKIKPKPVPKKVEVLAVRTEIVEEVEDSIEPPNYYWIPNHLLSQAKLDHLCPVLGRKGNNSLYGIRSYYAGQLLPGFYDAEVKRAVVTWFNITYRVTKFEVFCAEPNNYHWVEFKNDAVTIPSKAVIVGRTLKAEILYLGRNQVHNNVLLGKVDGTERKLFLAFNKGEIRYDSYEILCAGPGPKSPLDEEESNTTSSEEISNLNTTLNKTIPVLNKTLPVLNKTLPVLNKTHLDVHYKWIPASLANAHTLKDLCAPLGYKSLGRRKVSFLFGIRAWHGDHLRAGYLNMDENKAVVLTKSEPFDVKHFEVFCPLRNKFHWELHDGNGIPQSATKAGWNSHGEDILIVRQKNAVSNSVILSAFEAPALAKIPKRENSDLPDLEILCEGEGPLLRTDRILREQMSLREINDKQKLRYFDFPYPPKPKVILRDGNTETAKRSMKSLKVNAPNTTSATAATAADPLKPKVILRDVNRGAAKYSSRNLNTNNDNDASDTQGDKVTGFKPRFSFHYPPYLIYNVWNPPIRGSVSESPPDPKSFANDLNGAMSDGIPNDLNGDNYTGLSDLEERAENDAKTNGGGNKQTDPSKDGLKWYPPKLTYNVKQPPFREPYLEQIKEEKIGETNYGN